MTTTRYPSIALDARRGHAIAIQVPMSGRCVRCWMPWGHPGDPEDDRAGVSVTYQAQLNSSTGAFWLCRWCWDQLEMEEWIEWGRQCRHHAAIWPLIERALRSGEGYLAGTSIRIVRR